MKAGQAGFTLVEVLVALTIIGFVVLAAVPMFVLASQVNKSAGHEGTCAALAMERMEMLRGAAFASLIAGGSLDANTSGYVDTTHAGFVVRWRIVDLTVPAGGKQIDVRAVSLHTSMGPNKQVTFSTLRLP